jgi:hypothetical protein
MTGVAITRVGNHAGNGLARRFSARRGECGNLAGEFLGILRIKTAGNSGQAKHRICHPSVWRAMSPFGLESFDRAGEENLG